jgi:hypothetical protein
MASTGLHWPNEAMASRAGSLHLFVIKHQLSQDIPRYNLDAIFTSRLV